MDSMLSLENLHISVEQKPIIQGIDLNIAKGTVHALLGPNGSGKSTLAYTLAGHPSYVISKGSIFLDGVDITDASADQRARKGLFVAFQQLPAISGVSLFLFLKESYRAIFGQSLDVREFKALVDEYCELLNIDPSFLERSFYEGFSGGEKKRIELLQLLLFKPKIAVLDEIDSGVDVDSRNLITKALATARKNNPDMSMLIITHYNHLLKSIQPDYVHIIKEGRILESGSMSLVARVEKQGYYQV